MASERQLKTVWLKISMSSSEELVFKPCQFGQVQSRPSSSSKTSSKLKGSSPPYKQILFFSDSKLITNAKKGFEKGQSTEWVGKTVAALLNDPNIDSKAGRVIWCHDVSF